MKSNYSFHDQDSFYPRLLKDMSKSESRIIIQSPYLRIRRINKIFSDLKYCTSRGVRICVFARAPYKPSDKDLKELVACKKLLKSIDIHLNFVPIIHEKIVIIDENLTWEGSLNILSQNYSKERMTRWEGKRMAYNTIRMHKLNSCSPCAENKLDHSKIAGLIQRRRKELGLTQVQLASLAQVAPCVVSNFENGKTIKLDTLFKISSELHLGMQCLPEYKIANES